MVQWLGVIIIQWLDHEYKYTLHKIWVWLVDLPNEKGSLLLLPYHNIHFRNLHLFLTNLWFTSWSWANLHAYNAIYVYVRSCFEVDKYRLSVLFNKFWISKLTNMIICARRRGPRDQYKKEQKEATRKSENEIKQSEVEKCSKGLFVIALRHMELNNISGMK